MGNEKIRCIVVTAFGDIDRAVKKINPAKEDFVIAADYGYYKAKEVNLIPDLVLGDMDSVEIKDLTAEIEFQKFSPIKDDTDTLLAIKEGIKRGYLEFIILGGLGGRLDHTIANIQCMKYIKRLGGTCTIIDNNTRCAMIKNETVLVSPDYHYFSLFCLGDSAEGVTIKGFKYPLTDATITDWFPVGVSNEILAGQGEVTVKNGELFLIQTE